MENDKILKPSELYDFIDLIRSTRSSLVKLEEDYKNNFLKKVEILYALFRKNSKSSENWGRQMSFNIGTGIDDVSHELRSEIVLSRKATYLTYLCHIMLGCLVLKKELVCFLGEERKETEDILPVIKETADMLGLDVVFSTKDKTFIDETYKARCATFNLKKIKK